MGYTNRDISYYSDFQAYLEASFTKPYLYLGDPLCDKPNSIDNQKHEPTTEGNELCLQEGRQITPLR